jgi:hypothetical protein
MKLFSFLQRRRQPAQGFGSKSTRSTKSQQTFVLEPMLTLSGLVDVEQDGDNPFPESLLIAGDPGVHLTTPLSLAFESGVFQVTGNGEVDFDFLFDGGGYRGELGIFSLEGMDAFDPDSTEFIREAAQRVNSGSELGHIVISDPTEGARFSGTFAHEKDFNSGEYLGVKTVKMRSGDRFGLMLVPNGTFDHVLKNPEVGGARRPLFSLATANPDDHFHVGQLADVTGDGKTFVFEDLRVDTGSDEDYNDLIFRVEGAKGEAQNLDNVIDPEHDWRDTAIGQELLEYAQSFVEPDEPIVTLVPGELNQIDLDQIFVEPLEGEGWTFEVFDSGYGDLDLQIEGDQLIVGPAAPEVEIEQIAIRATNADGDSVIQRSILIVHGPDPAATGNLTDLLTTLPDVLATPGEAAFNQWIAQFDQLLETHPTLLKFVVQPELLLGLGIEQPQVDAVYQLLHSQELGQALGLPGSLHEALTETASGAWDRFQIEAEQLLPLATYTGALPLVGLIDFTKQNHDQKTLSILQSVNEESPYTLIHADDGNWAEKLTQFVDQVLTSGAPGAVVNLSFDLTQVDDQGRVTTRYELTPAEQVALQYAQDNGVLLVAAAGNTGDKMSALGVAAAEFDNLLVVGAVNRWEEKADYSAQGNTLSLVAPGGQWESDPEAFVGTSKAATYVTASALRIWADNPELNYQQVKQIILQTADDLATPGWDPQTGAGLLDLEEARQVALQTQGVPLEATADSDRSLTPFTGENRVIPGIRPNSDSVRAALASLQASQAQLLNDWENLQGVAATEITLEALTEQISNRSNAVLDIYQALSTDLAIKTAQEAQSLEVLELAKQQYNIQSQTTQSILNRYIELKQQGDNLAVAIGSEIPGFDDFLQETQDEIDELRVKAAEGTLEISYVYKQISGYSKQIQTLHYRGVPVQGYKINASTTEHETSINIDKTQNYTDAEAYEFDALNLELEIKEDQVEIQKIISEQEREGWRTQLNWLAQELALLEKQLLAYITDVNRLEERRQTLEQNFEEAYKQRFEAEENLVNFLDAFATTLPKKDVVQFLQNRTENLGRGAELLSDGIPLDVSSEYLDSETDLSKAQQAILQDIRVDRNHNDQYQELIRDLKQLTLLKVKIIDHSTEDLLPIYTTHLPSESLDEAHPNTLQNYFNEYIDKLNRDGIEDIDYFDDFVRDYVGDKSSQYLEALENYHKEITDSSLLSKTSDSSEVLTKTISELENLHQNLVDDRFYLQRLEVKDLSRIFDSSSIPTPLLIQIQQEPLDQDDAGVIRQVAVVFDDSANWLAKELARLRDILKLAAPNHEKVRQGEAKLLELDWSGKSQITQDAIKTIETLLNTELSDHGELLDAINQFLERLEITQHLQEVRDLNARDSQLAVEEAWQHDQAQALEQEIWYTVGQETFYNASKAAAQRLHAQQAAEIAQERNEIWHERQNRLTRLAELEPTFTAAQLNALTQYDQSDYLGEVIVQQIVLLNQLKAKVVDLTIALEPGNEKALEHMQSLLNALNSEQSIFADVIASLQQQADGLIPLLRFSVSASEVEEGYLEKTIKPKVEVTIAQLLQQDTELTEEIVFLSDLINQLETVPNLAGLSLQQIEDYIYGEHGFDSPEADAYRQNVEVFSHRTFFAAQLKSYIERLQQQRSQLQNITASLYDASHKADIALAALRERQALEVGQQIAQNQKALELLEVQEAVEAAIEKDSVLGYAQAHDALRRSIRNSTQNWSDALLLEHQITQELKESQTEYSGSLDNFILSLSEDLTQSQRDLKLANLDIENELLIWENTEKSVRQIETLIGELKASKISNEIDIQKSKNFWELTRELEGRYVSGEVESEDDLDTLSTHIKQVIDALIGALTSSKISNEEVEAEDDLGTLWARISQARAIIDDKLEKIAGSLSKEAPLWSTVKQAYEDKKRYEENYKKIRSDSNEVLRRQLQAILPDGGEWLVARAVTLGRRNALFWEKVYGKNTTNPTVITHEIDKIRYLKLTLDESGEWSRWLVNWVEGIRLSGGAGSGGDFTPPIIEDPNWDIAIDHAQKYIGYRNSYETSHKDYQVWKREEAELKAEQAQWQRASDALARVEDLFAQQQDNFELLAIAREVIPQKENFIDQVTHEIQTRSTELTETQQYVAESEANLEAAWDTYIASTDPYLKAVENTLAERGEFDKQGLYLQGSLTDLERLVEQRSLSIATSVTHTQALISSLKEALRKAGDALEYELHSGSGDAVAELATKYQQIETNLQLATYHLEALEAQQAALAQKRNLIAAYSQVIAVSKALADAYINSPDDDGAFLKELLQQVQQDLKEADRLAKEAEAKSQTLVISLERWEDELIAQQDQRVQAARTQQATLQNFVLAVETKIDTAEELVQEYQSLNDILNQIIALLETAGEEGRRQADALRNAAFETRRMGIAEVTALDFKDLGENEYGQLLQYVEEYEDKARLYDHRRGAFQNEADQARMARLVAEAQLSPNILQWLPRQPEFANTEAAMYAALELDSTPSQPYHPFDFQQQAARLREYFNYLAKETEFNTLLLKLLQERSREFEHGNHKPKLEDTLTTVLTADWEALSTAEDTTPPLEAFLADQLERAKLLLKDEAVLNDDATLFTNNSEIRKAYLASLNDRLVPTQHYVNQLPQQQAAAERYAQWIYGYEVGDTEEDKRWIHGQLWITEQEKAQIREQLGLSEEAIQNNQGLRAEAIQAQEDVNELHQKLETASENVEQLEQELRIAEVRRDNIEEILAQTERTYTTLVSWGWVYSAQAQAEQTLAKKNQAEIEQALNDWAIRESLAIDAQRAETRFQIEALKQYQREFDWQTALNKIRAELGLSDLTVVEAPVNGQMADLLAQLEALETEEPDLPEDLRNLLRQVQGQLHESLQGQEAEAIIDSLLEMIDRFVVLKEGHEQAISELDIQITTDTDRLILLTQDFGEDGAPAGQQNLNAVIRDLEREMQISDDLQDQWNKLELELQSVWRRITEATEDVILAEGEANSLRKWIDEVIEARIKRRKEERRNRWFKALGIVSMILSAVATIATIGSASPWLIGSLGLAAGAIQASIAGVKGDWFSMGINIVGAVLSFVGPLGTGTNPIIPKSLASSLKNYGGVLTAAINSGKAFASGNDLLGFLEVFGVFANLAAEGFSKMLTNGISEISKNTRALVQDTLNTLLTVPKKIYKGIESIKSNDIFAAIGSFFSSAISLASTISGHVWGLTSDVKDFIGSLGKYGKVPLILGQFGEEGGVFPLDELLEVFEKDLKALVDESRQDKEELNEAQKILDSTAGLSLEQKIEYLSKRILEVSPEVAAQVIENIENIEILGVISQNLDREKSKQINANISPESLASWFMPLIVLAQTDIPNPGKYVALLADASNSGGLTGEMLEYLKGLPESIPYIIPIDDFEDDLIIGNSRFIEKENLHHYAPEVPNIEFPKSNGLVGDIISVIGGLSGADDYFKLAEGDIPGFLLGKAEDFIRVPWITKEIAKNALDIYVLTYQELVASYESDQYTGNLLGYADRLSRWAQQDESLGLSFDYDYKVPPNMKERFIGNRRLNQGYVRGASRAQDLLVRLTPGQLSSFRIYLNSYGSDRDSIRENILRELKENIKNPDLLERLPVR